MVECPACGGEYEYCSACGEKFPSPSGGAGEHDESVSTPPGALFSEADASRLENYLAETPGEPFAPSDDMHQTLLQLFADFHRLQYSNAADPELFISSLIAEIRGRSSPDHDLTDTTALCAMLGIRDMLKWLAFGLLRNDSGSYLTEGVGRGLASALGETSNEYLEVDASIEYEVTHRLPLRELVNRQEQGTGLTNEQQNFLRRKGEFNAQEEIGPTSLGESSGD